MHVVIIGPGPRGAWVSHVLDRLAAAAAREKPLIISDSTRAAFDAASQAGVETLLLVDHVPDCIDPIASADASTAIGDAIRPHAMRLVLAFELAKRAERTIIL